MAMTETKKDALLEIQDLHLSFGGVRVLNDISLSVRQGDIFSIIGPNGAGKTSLINCVNMHYRPDSGAITFLGKELHGIKPHAVAALGIARTFQKVELFHGMTVLDNIKLGRHFLMKSSLLGSFFRLPNIVRDEMRHREEIEEEIIDFMGLSSFRYSPVGILPFGVRKRIWPGPWPWGPNCSFSMRSCRAWPLRRRRT